MTSLSSLLDELESLWHEHGLNVGDWFAPGRDPADVQSVLISHGLNARQEVLEWFAWHDGSALRPRLNTTLGPSNWEPLSLDRAISHRTMLLDGASQLAEDAGDQLNLPAETWWAPSWLPLGDNAVGGSLTIELTAAEQDAPIRVVDWEDIDETRLVRATSLSDVVNLWIGLLRTGNWRWSPAESRWIGDPTTLRSEGRVSGLVR
jgi:cell wall assembly regulator SMI1